MIYNPFLSHRVQKLFPNSAFLHVSDTMPLGQRHRCAETAATAKRVQHGTLHVVQFFLAGPLSFTRLHGNKKHLRYVRAGLSPFCDVFVCGRRPNLLFLCFDE